MKLYYVDSMPDHWVGEVDGKLWIFPAVCDGWDLRVPYNGVRMALKVAIPYGAPTTGWPGHAKWLASKKGGA